MKKISLKNLNVLEIDTAPGERAEEDRFWPRRYGCDQNWYGTEWQRRAGCGPSTASNMLLYMSGGRAAGESVPASQARENFLALMEDVWAYVTPTDRGIPTTELFYEPFLRYAAERDIGVVRYGVLDMFDEPRGKLAEVVSFIGAALAADLPVAFLNLCSGGEENLDRWHWVTVVSLEYDGLGDEKGENRDGNNEEKAGITILDNGELKKADLALWRRTTTLGGGFVWFDLSFGPAAAIR
ncbi:MAG: hypothetical protein LBR71_00195 [Synergistaceae bacterium]|jgi:hypothetical protein|nr:hypothetical protein [Synergistaceae bacterium]